VATTALTWSRQASELTAEDRTTGSPACFDAAKCAGIEIQPVDWLVAARYARARR
jgi:hypothetical protein